MKTVIIYHFFKSNYIKIKIRQYILMGKSNQKSKTLSIKWDIDDMISCRQRSNSDYNLDKIYYLIVLSCSIGVYTNEK